MDGTIVFDETHCVSLLNSLRRGERSAVDAYLQAREKFAGHPAADVLEGIQADHEESVSELEACILNLNGTPESSPGLWGGIAATVQATANLLGKGPATGSLMAGEEIGRKAYLNTAEDPELPFSCKFDIQSVQIPRIDDHIAKLSALQTEFS